MERPMTDSRPSIRLRPREHKRVVQGHPWIYSNELVMDAAAKAIPPGGVVRVLREDGGAVGTAMFNPHTLIAARMLDRDADAAVDAAWIRAKLERALTLRERLFHEPYYRLTHAEADGLPGLVIDRYGDVIVAALNTAGMVRLRNEIEAALKTLIAPRTLIYAGEGAARHLEGLEPEHSIAFGALDGSVALKENGIIYHADLMGGQKTGWFYDQRSNRQFVAGLARGARVLDAYCYAGGFALACAKGGAASVLGLDRSRDAIALAQRSAQVNDLSSSCRFETGEVFETLARWHSEGTRFDIVIADPPAFAKSRKDIPAALKGYRKLTRLSASLVAEGGILLLASCSHHITQDALLAEVNHALNDLSRRGRLIRASGAGPDHPLHPSLPESGYLKALFFALD